jgi:hypothetical protein
VASAKPPGSTATAGATQACGQTVILPLSDFWSGQAEQPSSDVVPIPDAPMSAAIAIFTAIALAWTGDMPKPAATETAINRARRCLANQRIGAIYIADRVFSTQAFAIDCG